MVDLDNLDWATIFTWMVRISLPIIFFWIYFKPLRSKEEDEGNEGLLQNEHIRQEQREPTGPNCYSRRRMLAHRQAVTDEPAPDSLKTVTMQVRSTQAPRPARAPRKEGKPEKRSGSAVEEKAPRRPKPRPAPESTFVAAPTPASAEATEIREAESKMHLACLVNYVAFNYKEPQRHFLMEEGVPPPPPPRAKQSTESIKVSEEVATKTNKEAQMILQGALRFKASSVAKALHQDLSEQQVEISESTFTLMIETAVAAADLKSASDLLMKMETAGGCPDTELLDKVMDLYSQQKSKREQQRQAAVASANTNEQNLAAEGVFAAQVMAPLIPNEDFIRAKLSSKAPAFVPTFSTVPTPPPPPAHPAPVTPTAAAPAEESAAATGAGEGSGEELAATGSEDGAAGAAPSSDPPSQAPAEEPQPDRGGAEAADPANQTAKATTDAPADTTEAVPQQRTKLVSSAKPFEPQSTFNVGYDPYSYGWPADHHMALGGYGPIYAEGIQGGGWGQGSRHRWTSPEAEQQDTWVMA
mmetsp:Transcript_35758/g.77301  ORF Transcript_35758/g.77301 Transcript_35758/m.77301 type:complete len:527 (-) Transcript_35758:328-1908(-)|eukprot:CAMPEP_0206562066 /NCGR_PEP_ID=MMETSP0325_2-20121206/22003_1 /ASSEMBLY_ACC=CAM_ASM_000347 /TAXON_ID=2866 /ORGANISM="Crypthecodinium cohnii, Strain Seligo" /LENGTH=526 /DNA_ID=CAMNT_0054064157 /DNA_START=166 /DNA_END=1746 /DNA_ORIENTATION=-